ncbi:unnamed protein product [Protopolystoma xenopodis]|uniref:Uncharacterized protein n=1 Tax=Protopolystoma xenopodis TaxID=117903 RepID=A0A448X2W1_9PLAT|nr:unnamed protein product [Protopolystoma xenopodis]
MARLTHDADYDADLMSGNVPLPRSDFGNDHVYNLLQTSRPENQSHHFQQQQISSYSTHQAAETNGPGTNTSALGYIETVPDLPPHRRLDLDRPDKIGKVSSNKGNAIFKNVVIKVLLKFVGTICYSY